jgi:hypothetical protein
MTRERSEKARRLADDAGQWIRVRDRRTRRPLCYGIRSESEPGHHHAVTLSTCCCQWAQHHDADRDPCSHILAVRIHVNRARARRRQSYAVAVRPAA